jgi:hypothetical protein
MRRDRRRNFRVEWNSPSTVYDVDRHFERPCVVSNFSNDGARITGVRVGAIPDERIARVQARARKCRVIWRTDDSLGVERRAQRDIKLQAGGPRECTLNLLARIHSSCTSHVAFG